MCSIVTVPTPAANVGVYGARHEPPLLQPDPGHRLAQPGRGSSLLPPFYSYSLFFHMLLIFDACFYTINLYSVLFQPLDLIAGDFHEVFIEKHPYSVILMETW